MPQLDTASFFTQYVWLMVCYIGMYLTLVKYFLPKLARISKLRAAKVHASLGTETSEVLDVQTAGETCVVASVKHARSVCADHFATTSAWVDSVVSEHASTSVSSAHNSVHALSTLHFARLQDSAAVLHPRAHSHADMTRTEHTLLLLKIALLVQAKKAQRSKK